MDKVGDLAYVAAGRFDGFRLGEDRATSSRTEQIRHVGDHLQVLGEAGRVDERAGGMGLGVAAIPSFFHSSATIVPAFSERV